MRILALSLMGLALVACGCQPGQSIVGGSIQDNSAQRSSMMQVSHVSQEHEQLPLASEVIKGQTLKKLTGLDLLPETSFDGPYRALTADQCKCRAAQASSMGNQLEQEAASAPTHGRKGDLRQSLLSNSSLEARNKDAATALELFYRLAEAEARWALLAGSIDQVGKANAHGQKLKKQGLPLPPDVDQFTKQDFDLKSDRVRLEVGIEKFNRNLARRIEVAGVPEEERLWPVGDFAVPAESVDLAAAVALGMAHRPELQFLRQASEDAGLGNLSELRKALSASNALLGTSGGPCKKLIAILCKDETGNRRQQLQQLQRQREREIADDIREAAQDMNAQVRLIAISYARSRHAAAKLKEAEDKQAKGTGSVFEVSSARLTWLKAKDQQVREVIAWHLAQTRLQEAQGILTQGCDPHADLLSCFPPALSSPQEFPPMETRTLPQYRRTYTGQ
jgi:hypothetical protein